jgi:3-dehydroquinate synthase
VLWPGFLITLTNNDFLSGVGEVAKLHILAGAAERRLWERSRLQVLARQAAATEKLMWSSLVIKRKYLIKDEFDTGVRQYLNYGHCFGHAIEAATAFRVPHGQAVVLGMELANYLGVARGLMREENRQDVFDRYLAGVRTARVRLNRTLVRHVIDAMGQDKKRIGKGFAVIVLDNALNPIKLTDVTEPEIRATLARWEL